MKVLKKHWKYKNLTMVFLGFVFTLFLSRTEGFNLFISKIGSFGYIGAFFAGMLFVSTFTVTTGALILFDFAKTLNPINLALVAGIGAVVGDLLIFKLVRDDLLSELKDIYNKDFNGRHLNRILHTKYFSWMMPVVGAIIIASPLPDEAGISLMGISKISSARFIMLSYLLNSLGIFTAISLGRV